MRRARSWAGSEGQALRFSQVSIWGKKKKKTKLKKKKKKKNTQINLGIAV